MPVCPPLIASSANSAACRFRRRGLDTHGVDPMPPPISLARSLAPTPQGADVNAGDVEQQTALHFACAGGHVDAARLLIKFGADVRARNEDGQVGVGCGRGAGVDAGAGVGVGVDEDVDVGEIEDDEEAGRRIEGGRVGGVRCGRAGQPAAFLGSGYQGSSVMRLMIGRVVALP